MLELKLNRVSKRGPWWVSYFTCDNICVMEPPGGWWHQAFENHPENCILILHIYPTWIWHVIAHSTISISLKVSQTFNNKINSWTYVRESPKLKVLHNPKDNTCFTLFKLLNAILPTSIQSAKNRPLPTCGWSVAKLPAHLCYRRFK